MPSSIKIGLLVTDDYVPLWVAEIVTTLRDADYAELTLLLVDRPPADSPPTGLIADPSGQAIADGISQQTSQDSESFLYRTFRNLDSRMKRVEPFFAEPVHLPEVQGDVRKIVLPTSISKESGRADGLDAEAICDANLDILFCPQNVASASKLAMQPDTIATYGIWALVFGDNENFRAEPAGFWEMTNGAGSTGVSLQIVKPEPADNIVISRSSYLPDILLLGRQQQNVLMQCASLFTAEVKRLSKAGPEKYFALIEKSNHQPLFYSGPLLTTPTNRETLWQLAKHYARYLALKLKNLVFYEQWCLLVNYREDGELSRNIGQFSEIVPPADRIWADPFVIMREGQYHVFFEEMEYLDHRGRIATMTIDADGKHSEPVTVLEQPYHLSYPFLFEHEGQLFMIPETGEKQAIQLYRCIDFPHQWEFEKNLMEGEFAVDTTLHEIDGIWWMFTTLRENRGTDSLNELHIFYADSPLSNNWQAHAGNPVSRDVGNARPAGKLFHFNEQLYRPSQNGNYHYGHGLNINLISHIDSQEYREECICNIEPEWSKQAIAIHTLNHADGMTVADSRKLRLRYERAFKRIAEAIR